MDCFSPITIRVFKMNNFVGALQFEQDYNVAEQ